VNESPDGSSDPGRASTPAPSFISKAKSELDIIDPLFPSAVTDALVNVVLPKSASTASEQVEGHSSGLSTIHSAEDWPGGVAESLILVEKVQPAVSSLTRKVQISSDTLTEALIVSPGEVGYKYEARLTRYPPFTLASPHISYQEL
jgi:hypothetical protein